MSAHSRWFEAFIAALGVCVTAILGWGQWRLSEQQNRILDRQTEAAKASSIDVVEVQVMTLVSPHLAALGSGTEEGKRAERVVLAAAEYLTDQYGRTSLAEMATKISENSEVSAPTETRLAEAREVAPESKEYFTVLASLAGDDLEGAKNLAKKKSDEARQNGLDEPVQIYKTMLSNKYAVVLGGKLKETEAKSLAAAARSTGVAEDSFHQVNKQWKLVENIAPRDPAKVGVDPSPSGGPPRSPPSERPGN